MRKSQQIRELEERHGKPLAEIVVEAYNAHQTIEAAAAAIDVNPNTFAFWLNRLPIRVLVEKKATVAS